METIYKLIGLKIQRIREITGETQDDYAKKLGYTRAYLSSIERAKSRIQIHDLEKLCHKLNITLKIFFKGIID